MMSYFKYTITTILLMASFNCNATIYETNGIKWNIQGFLGYKTIWTQDSQPFLSVNDSPEMGVIISSNLTEKLQVYFFGRYARNLIGAAVYAEARYLLPNFVDDLNLSVRGGQLINDFGLYNSTRVNPRTRATIWLPQSIYPATLRGEIASGLGVGFDGKYKNITFGYSIMQKNIIGDPVDEAKEWSTRLHSVNNYFGDSQLAYLQYKSDEGDWRVKASYSKLDFGNDYEGVPRFISSQLKPAGNQTLILSGEWQIDPKWYISVEGYGSKQTSAAKSPGNIYAYSIMGRHELTDNVTLYANWNQFLSPYKNLPPVDQLREKHQEFILGGNWHKNNWQIGAEAHHVSGGRFVNYGNFISQPDSYKDFWIFGGNLIYFFD